MSDLHASVADVLRSWEPPSAQQDALRHAYLGFLDAREDAHMRTCSPGHVTASAALLSADGRRTLLTLHPRVGRWLQLGGHLEDDSDVVAAALRECVEESGIEGIMVDPVPIDLDCHPITCRGYTKPTRHFDVRFLAVAPDGAVETISEESLDLRWFPVEALPDVSDEVAALIRAAVARFRDGSQRA